MEKRTLRLQFRAFARIFTEIPTDYKLFLLVFLFIACVCFAIFMQGGGNVADSIMPELIGFCLDGAFFVIVFSAYEKRKEATNKAKYKKVLRASILAILNDIYRLVYEADELNDPRVNYATDPIYVESLLVKTRERLNGKVFKSPKQLLDTIVDNIDHWYAMYPVAALIDSDHFYVWQKLTKILEWVPKRSEGYHMHNEIWHFLNEVKKFDALPLNHETGT